MAKFTEMRSFVKVVKAHNDKEASDERVKAFAKEGDIEYTLWITRNDAKKEFATAQGVSDEKAQEVYEDTVSDKYKYIRVHTVNLPHEDKRLWVGSEGRHLLEKTGMWRAWADDNKNIATIILAVITGIIIGGAGVVIAIIGLHKP